MGFYAQANFEGETVVHARLTNKGQDTRIELSFNDFLKVLDDFTSDCPELPKEQYDKLVEYAFVILGAAPIRGMVEACKDCDGTDCASCERLHP